MIQSNCGLIIDGTTLKNLNGVFTLGSSTEIINKTQSSVCGGLCYDTDVFKIVKEVCTLKNDDKTSFDIIYGNCGQKFDSEYFTINKGILSQVGNIRSTIKFNASQEDAIIEVKEGTKVINPISKNTYRLENGKTYSYVAKKEGYQDASNQITVNGDEIIAIIMVKNN